MNSYEYQVGGSLPPDAPSYVKRQADEDIYRALKQNHYCYVLNSRQMGKSSLGVRTWQRLQQEGIACAFIYIDKVGGGTATADQWYGGIIRSLTNDFNLRQEFDVRAWLQERNFLPPAQRLSEFVEEILLKKITQPIVIFLDEIDSVLGLDFCLDDFFALIRYFYNQRAINPEFQRLTFVLLGVASPADLIQDPTKTPFNIGTAIELQGFKLSELQPLVEGLKEKASEPLPVMEEILYWTGGQPYLTQKLCDLVSQINSFINRGNEKAQIEELVFSKIVNDWESQDEHLHLQTIQQRIVDDEKNNVDLLENYRTILEKEEMAANKIESEMLLRLRLSGLVVKQQGKVSVYNEIYKRVFNIYWIDTELSKIRPYARLMINWYTSECKDKSKLIQGKALKKALQWTEGKSLSDRDYKYLNATRELKDKTNFRNLLIWLGIVVSCFYGLSQAKVYVYEQSHIKYGYCPEKEGIVGEKIGEGKNYVCFRFMITSGDKKLFISDSNYHLDKGSEFFRKDKYQEAMKLFEQAIDGDRTAPVPQIYFNNARARQKGNPLKLAVVVPVDYYEDAAKAVLKGVANAQDKFNNREGKNGRLLEIVIANDGNQPLVSERVARNLANDQDILGIIGHHASESSKVALPIYQDKGVAIVSPTSSSSQLTGDVFFRAVSTTKVAAQAYANYIKYKLNLDEIAVFYMPKSEYSKTLYSDFENAFRKQGGEIVKLLDLSDTQLNIRKEIQSTIKQNIRAILLFPNVTTNSVAITIARENDRLPSTQKLKLIGSMALSEQATLEKGGKAVEGMILASPCLDKNADYMLKAKNRWEPKETDWRTTSSYDATQAFIKAIRLSKEPTREEILKQLQSKDFTLPVGETSGFGLKWDSGHSNANRGYCMFEIRNHQFQEIPKDDR